MNIVSENMFKKNRIVRKLIHRLEYGSIRFFSAVFMILPLKLVYIIAKLLGVFTYNIIRIRRDVTVSNLKKSLGGELGEKELKRIARESYMNIGLTFIEMLLIPKFAGHVLDMVDMSDSYILKHAMDTGNGVILVSCHFGNWELNGAAIAISGFPVTVVAKKQSNPYVDSLVNLNRTRFGMNIITPGASVKHIVRALRKHEIVGLISDQDAGRNGIFVDFFGRKASTPRGAAQLALKYNAPIVVTMSVRTGSGKYKSIFKNVNIRADDTVESITQRYTTVMENIIRRHPGQYFWMHRRWKTVPIKKDPDKSK